MVLGSSSWPARPLPGCYRSSLERASRHLSLSPHQPFSPCAACFSNPPSTALPTTFEVRVGNGGILLHTRSLPPFFLSFGSTSSTLSHRIARCPHRSSFRFTLFWLASRVLPRPSDTLQNIIVDFTAAHAGSRPPPTTFRSSTGTSNVIRID